MGSRGSKSENISSARALFYTNANLQDITYPGDNGYFTTDKPVLKNGMHRSYKADPFQ